MQGRGRGTEGGRGVTARGQRVVHPWTSPCHKDLCPVGIKTRVLSLSPLLPIPHRILYTTCLLTEYLSLNLPHPCHIWDWNCDWDWDWDRDRDWDYLAACKTNEHSIIVFLLWLLLHLSFDLMWWNWMDCSGMEWIPIPYRSGLTWNGMNGWSHYLVLPDRIILYFYII